MSISSSVKQRSPLRCAGAVLVVALGVAACGSSSGESDDAAAVDPIPQVDASDGIAVPTTHQTADGPGVLQYGDSLSDLARPDAETVNLVLPGFTSVEWEDLVPQGFSGEQILERYQDRLDAAEPGSAELDAIYAEMNAEYDNASVNTDLAGEAIQLAGFIAPLTFDGDNITEFLLVPYFGACIHVPAPPVNQTVIVTLEEGESITLEESWGAVWVAGTLSADSAETSLATAGYTMSDAKYGVYQTQ